MVGDWFTAMLGLIFTVLNLFIYMYAYVIQDIILTEPQQLETYK